MNTISKILSQQKSKCALIPFITAGYPNIKATINAIKELDCHGADLIELGVPYSDALADGPIIQNASLIAIKQKVYVDQVLFILNQVSKTIRVPIIIFTYYNPILKRGISCFIKEVSCAGAKGLIIPDLPLEEADNLIILCQNYNIELILFVAPTSSLSRINLITNKSPGCIYLVSSTGVTGQRKSIDKITLELANYIKKVSNKVIMLGFGISNASQARQLAKLNIDGLVIGTAFIQKLSECANQDNMEEIRDFCVSIKNAITNDF